MKSEIQKIIELDLESSIPKGFNERIRNRILSSITKPLPWYKKIPREDVILVLSVIFFSSLVYIIGSNPAYKVSINIDKGIASNIGMAVSFIVLVSFFTVSEYFDRKKNIGI